MDVPSDLENLPSASLLRLLIAIIYDSFLLFSMLLVAAALAYPVTGGQVSLGYQIYLLIVCFFYFAWPWLRGGQTLGMKAWRIQVQSINGKALSWRQALLRFLMAILSWLVLGIGFFWAIVDKQHRTWHDWVSETRIVLRPKRRS
jgi:uncharacterized RDD family membrane protein YckC